MHHRYMPIISDDDACYLMITTLVIDWALLQHY
jgi:hypothetical protein